MIFDILLGKKGVCFMKKLASFCLASIMAMSAASAESDVVVQRSPVGRRVMVREYQPYSVETAKGWYMGGRLALNMLNWTNEYSTNDANPVSGNDSDKYSFETLFGGSVFAGTDFQLSDEWFRAEVEAGLMGQFTDKDQGIEFKMTVPYVIANGYYDFVNGLYAGAGLGLALPKTELDWAALVGGERSERAVSPMLALMLGWSYDLDARITLDLRYRLSGFWGPEHTRSFADGVEFTTDVGFVLENSLSMGLRYRF